MRQPRFQTVLDLHRAGEDAARRRLGHLEGERVALAANVSALLAERVAASADVPPHFHEQLARFTAAMGLRIAGAQAALRAKEAEIDQARDVLRAAHRQVATFAKLQELDRRALARQDERRATRAADEFAQRRRSPA